jgi:ribonuclease Z
MLDYFCRENPFEIRFNPISPSSTEAIYSDRSVTVRAIPLKHRIPTCGFLFEEAEGERHLRGDMIEFYNIPTYCRAGIKQGLDYTTPEGKVIPNAMLTQPPTPAARYAYCSDTMYTPRIAPYIEGVDVLYHEATYGDQEEPWARKTFHSTARQAATLAKQAQVGKLVIGHFSSRYKDEKVLLAQAQEVFPNTTLAHEGMKIILKK